MPKKKQTKQTLDEIPVIAPLLDDEPISDAYAVIDNDLSAADREDL